MTYGRHGIAANANAAPDCEVLIDGLRMA